MMTTISSVLLLLLLATASHARPCDGEFLVNGNFENGAQGWQGVNDPNNAGGVFFSMEDPFEGVLHLKMTEAAGVTRAIYQCLKGTPGLRYFSSGVHKGTNVGAGGQARSRIQFFDGDGFSLGHFDRAVPQGVNLPYLAYRHIGDAPPGTETVMLGLLLLPPRQGEAVGDTEVFVDMVEFGVDTPPPTTTSTTSTTLPQCPCPP